MTENIPLYEHDIIIDSIICNFYDDDDIWEAGVSIINSVDDVWT